MFMRYRGGGIGHTYMREVEDRFKDMRREQGGLECAPQATQPPQDAGNGTGAPTTNNITKTVTPTGNAPIVDGGSEDQVEGRDREDEWEDIPPEDDCLNEEDGDRDSDEDGDEDSDKDSDVTSCSDVDQSTYGMAEY